MTAERRHGSRATNLAHLAARQHGVVSRRQLRSLGFGEASIAHEVATGRLHRILRAAYAVGHPAIDDRGRMMAAVLACGAGTLVSHRSAAELNGLVDQSPVVVDVIGPRQAGRRIDGVRAYRVPPPGETETTVVDAIPCTTTARTIVDLAAVVGERSLRAAVERAAVRRSLDVHAVECILAASRRRGAATLRAILQDWRGPSEAVRGSRPRLRSELEARMVSLVASHGLPAPQCNQIVQAEGNQFEVDLLWPAERLVVETDGRGYHSSPAAFERDRQRDRLLLAAGYRVVRVTARQLAAETTAVITTLRGLLTSG